MNKALLHTINLVLGDWSGDGHRVTQSVVISSNFDKSEIEKTYKAGAKKIGVNVTDNVTEEYEDNQISFKDWQKFEDAGMSLEQLFGKDTYSLNEAKNRIENKEDFEIYSDEFVQLWLFTVMVGSPNFKYKIENTNETVINIGGYGLMGS